MDTCYAPAQKTQKLAIEIDAVSNNPVMSGLLHSVGGLLAILDRYRQIVALNDSFLKILGIDDPAKVLGLRPGEALECIHAHEAPAGCGTTKYCSTCGAAIAIVSCLEQDEPVERICALSVKKNGKAVETALHVRAHRIFIDKEKFLLLFLQDITKQQQRAALERTFFHDINNMLSMLVGASEIHIEDDPSKLALTIHRATLRLLKEVSIQRYLSQGETCNYEPTWNAFTTNQVLDELRAFFANHPAAHQKNVDISKSDLEISITTDISLLIRVLCNMVLNALEATAKNGNVSVWTERKGAFLTFCVWNTQTIAPEVARRIFQCNFSTKEQAGRGIGTYSMKLFGEGFLKGKVNFKSSKEDGTIFQVSLPL